MPIKTSKWSTMSFFSTEPDEPGLGGKVEFWMGEGKEAEKYIIEQTTTILIPRTRYIIPYMSMSADGHL